MTVAELPEQRGDRAHISAAPLVLTSPDEVAHVLQRYFSSANDHARCVQIAGGDLDRNVGINAATWRRWITKEPEDASRADFIARGAREALDKLHEGGWNGFGTHHIGRRDLVELARCASDAQGRARLFVSAGEHVEWLLFDRGPGSLFDYLNRR